MWSKAERAKMWNESAVNCVTVFIVQAEKDCVFYRYNTWDIKFQLNEIPPWW
jgi:hypothetical protein